MNAETAYVASTALCSSESRLPCHGLRSFSIQALPAAAAVLPRSSATLFEAHRDKADDVPFNACVALVLSRKVKAGVVLMPARP
jgi:hypothetical protein